MEGKFHSLGVTFVDGFVRGREAGSERDLEVLTSRVRSGVSICEPPTSYATACLPKSLSYSFQDASPHQLSLQLCCSLQYAPYHPDAFWVFAVRRSAAYVDQEDFSHRTCTKENTQVRHAHLCTASLASLCFVVTLSTSTLHPQKVKLAAMAERAVEGRAGGGVGEGGERMTKERTGMVLEDGRGQDMLR